ncbi:hypothetical protein RJ640_012805 [Escallonia rubra]|uniref:Uncharacterized protein n=1 Tax=Escallonia rubra TaxID=112253 RepID=A0AA88RPT6_9ASTE|nr:hypothetical protein RJ640_012805 [Escallonia rubra]
MVTTKDARFSLTGERHSASWEDRMLMGGNYDLNSSESCGDSPTNVLRQTMINQELAFMKQVRELHRLHKIQKTLMMDFGQREINGYNLGEASSEPSQDHCRNQMRYQHLAKECTFSTIPMVRSTQSVCNDFYQEGKSICSRLQQRPLDLQRPSSQYADHIGWDLLNNGNNWGGSEKSAEIKHSFCGDYLSCPEEVKLCLRTGGDTEEVDLRRQTWKEKITYSSSEHIIDLEESTVTASHAADEKPVFSLGCSAPVTFRHKHESGKKHGAQVPAQSSQNFIESLTRSPFRKMTMADSSLDGSRIYQKQNFFNQGLDERRGDIQCNTMFTSSKLFTSNEMAELDLNKVQPDESSFHSNDPEVAHPVRGCSLDVTDGVIVNLHGGASPTAISWKEPSSKHLDVASALLRRDISQALMDSNSFTDISNISATSATCEAASGSQVCPIDLESVSGPPPDLIEDLNNHSRNSDHDVIDMPLRFQDGNRTDLAITEVNGEKRKEDIVFEHLYKSQNVVEETRSSRSPVSCKSGCTADDNSSSIKTMLSGTDFGESNLSPSSMSQLFELSQAGETPGLQDQRSSNNSELKNQCCNKKEGESAGVDILIQKAAISLICMSLESSNAQDCITREGSNEIDNKKREQPQVSSDSYESLVLNLKECTADDYCVSSHAYEVGDLGTKECGIKLRRGRRLKDFQKDILPSLASLSRYEICEDINIMDGVLRSREYKKFRSKMSNGENWFTPVRNRRSRLNYVGRRYYS